MQSYWDGKAWTGQSRPKPSLLMSPGTARDSGDRGAFGWVLLALGLGLVGSLVSQSIPTSALNWGLAATVTVVWLVAAKKARSKLGRVILWVIVVVQSLGWALLLVAVGSRSNPLATADAPMDLASAVEANWEEITEIMGPEWSSLQPGDLATDASSMCEMLDSDPPENIQTLNDFGNDLAAERYRLLTGLSPSREVQSVYFGAIMGVAFEGCPAQYAHADSLLLEDLATKELNDPEVALFITSNWYEWNAGNWWRELPNEAFSVGDITRLSEEFCLTFSQDGAEKAETATKREVGERIPSASESEMIRAVDSIAAVGTTLICAELRDAWVKYVQP